MKLPKVKTALAPMTNLQSNLDGTLGDDEYNWLVSRAKAGFDVVISCASHVSPSGQGWPGQLACYDDKFLPGLTKLAAGIHEHDSLAILQVFHGGYFADPKLVPKRLSASALQFVENLPPATSMTEEEIIQLIDDFVLAAKRAEQAGWDGVEVHGANGYIFSQFLGTVSNQRQDQWGGSLENRFRILKSTIKKIKENTSKNFVVGVRLSPEDSPSRPGGLKFSETLELIPKLEELGIDYIHISMWDVFKLPSEQDVPQQNMIQQIKSQIKNKTPLMAAGEIWTKSQAQKAHELGVDVVAIGKAAITTEDWPERVYERGDEPIRPPVSKQHLAKSHVGSAFVEYMSKWPGFVEGL